MSAPKILVRTEAVGLGFIQNHPKTSTNDRSLIATGLVELKPDTPFWVIGANLKGVPVSIHRNTVVGIILPPPKVILEAQNFEENRSNKEITEEGRDDEEWQEKIRVGRS